MLLGDVGDEREEVDRLPVEAEGVHPPQGERGVPDPGEAVVVVAVAARRLRKRGTAGRHDGARRGVGEPLESQRTALQVAAPRVVGEPAAGQPVLPVVGRPHLLLVCVGVAGGRDGATPRQGDEPDVALLEQGAGAGLPALETQPHVGGEGQRDVAALGARPGLVVALTGVLPADVRASVVEHRLAVHDGLHLAGHAADGAQQDVLGLVVVGGAAVGERAVVLVVPRTDQQRVAHDDPAGGGAPAGLKDHRPGQVAAVGRHHDVQRCHPERAGAPAQDGAEHARRVKARHAHPVHRAAGGDQRRHLTVAEEPVVTDRHRPGMADRAGEPVASLPLLRHVCSIPCARGGEQVHTPALASPDASTTLLIAGPRHLAAQTFWHRQPGVPGSRTRASATGSSN